MRNYDQEALKRMVPFANRLLKHTEGCRIDMHEPDEQDLSARVTGASLDNAMSDDPKYGEMIVILKRGFNPKNNIEYFNLATLIALARIGAKTLIQPF